MRSRRTTWAVIAIVGGLVTTTLAQEPAGVPSSATVKAAPTHAALSFGTFPSHSLVQLEAFYAQLALYLTESVGRPVRFGTSSSYTRFRDRLQRNEFDIAFIQASEYMQIAAGQGYVPLLRAHTASLLFIVRPDSSLRSLGDLRGRTVALPPMEEDATSVALRRLREDGLQADRDIQIEYLPQNNACLQHVISGRSAAAAISEDALRFAGARVGVDYRVIDSGAQVVAPLFVAAARLSVAERKVAADALRGWSLQPANQGSPMSLGWMRLVDVTDGDYRIDASLGPIHSAGDSAKQPSGVAPESTRSATPRRGS